MIKKTRGIVCGIGINDIGYTAYDKQNKTWLYRVYCLWRRMLYRSTGGKRDKGAYYKVCSICKEWLVFSNFLADVVKIPNYELWLNNPGKRIALDKDIRGKYHNHYCLHYCSFVTASDNSKERVKRCRVTFHDPEVETKRLSVIKRPTCAVNIRTGFIITTDSIKAMADLLGFSCNTLYSVMKKKKEYKEYQGYKFFYLPKESVV